MGKSQKKKSMRRHNPMRVPDSHLPKGLNSASQSSSKSNEILPIIQKMESADIAERKWACVAVSNLIQNDPSTRRLLQGRNVVGALITRLTDGEVEVVSEAVGALRNLCVDGGYDICAEMYNKNILTPLKTFIPKISATISQFLADSKEPKTTVSNFADNIITILWCLSETSNKALNAINDIHLVPFLMSFLDAHEKLALAPVMAAAQCLYVLTDDNAPAIEEVRADGRYIACLSSIARKEQNWAVSEAQIDLRSITLSILAAGTLCNISPIPPPSAASFIDINKDIILPLLYPVITVLSLQATTVEVQELIHKQVSEPQIEDLSLRTTPKSDHRSSTGLQLEAIESKLRAVQLSLEILTGICGTLPDPEPDVTEEENHCDEDFEIDTTGDIEMMVESEAPLNGNGTSPPFAMTLVPPLLALIQPTALSFLPLAAQSIHPPTTSAISALHIAALECLNNIFVPTLNPVIMSEVINGLAIWDAVWSALSLVGTQVGLGQERRQEFWDVAVGVLWGVGRVWKGSLIPSNAHIKVLVDLCNTSSDSKVRVKCIGALECLAQTPTAIEANKIISDYLITLLPTSTAPSAFDPEPMVQAVSALIDIYSDETLPYDVNFRQNKFLDRLVDCVEGVRKTVRAIDRRKNGGKELRQRGDEVHDNLVEFIQYRRDLKF